MGEVYLAQDTKLNRKVAIKFLTADSLASEQANKRLLREAEAAAKLDHPNICAVHEVAEENGRNFIVMPYVEGETLDLRIKRKSLELSESLAIAAQVADALAEAHTHGIIHRDIKPSNIIITLRGQAKVMDFGLAKLLEPPATAGRLKIDTEASTQAFLTTPGAIIGTMPYMSPEQVHGQTLDGRSDIFSFGVVLYEMLTGQQPFAGKSVRQPYQPFSRKSLSHSRVTRLNAPKSYSGSQASALRRIVSGVIRRCATWRLTWRITGACRSQQLRFDKSSE